MNYNFYQIENVLEEYRKGTSSSAVIIQLIKQAMNWAYEEGKGSKS